MARNYERILAEMDGAEKVINTIIKQLAIKIKKANKELSINKDEKVRAMQAGQVYAYQVVIKHLEQIKDNFYAKEKE